MIQKLYITNMPISSKALCWCYLVGKTANNKPTSTPI